MKSVLIKATPDYEFYSDGRIWSKYYQRFLDGDNSDKRGYNRVELLDGRELRHIVIAKMFILNPENKSEVHHIDGNTANNRVSNLMWVTHKEHMDIHKEKHPIEMCTMDWQHEAYFDSISEASRKTKINKGNIRNCLNENDRHQSAGGHRFRYINKETGLGANGL